MNSLSLWISVVNILCLGLLMPCDSYSIYEQREKQLKMLDMEYGERLSSVENVRVRLKAPNSDTGTTKNILSTRCTTDQAITVDPNFNVDSHDSNDNNIENEDGQGMNDHTYPGNEYTTSLPTKEYIPPAPRGTDPDHYLDDV